MMLLSQILLAALALGLLIAWHEFGHYLLARLLGMRVLRFAIGFGPKLIGFTKSQIEYLIGVFPIGGYVQIKGMSPSEEGAQEDPQSFINGTTRAKIAVIAAGPIFNFALAFVLFFCVFWFWSTGSTPSLLMNQVAKDSPAAAAGVQEGDVLVQMDHQALLGSADFLARIQASHGKPIVLTLERNNESKNATDTVELTVAPTKSTDGVYRIGVGYVPLSFSFGGALAESLSQIWTQSTGVLTQLGSLLVGQSKSLQLGGVVEITRQLSHAASQGLRNFLWMMGSLSVVLGLFNILPIPALDGSKIFILLIEKIIGRPIPEKAQIWIHVSGFVLILALMLTLTVFDVLRIYRGT